MPETTWNRDVFGGSYDWSYDWSGGGEEWSVPWGGSGAQWFASLLPRLRCFVPCRSILEIAPGYGRWTRFLLPLCEEYAGIDISETCIAACRARFPSKGTFHTNDGYSLAAVGEQFDLVFSFDALVHVEMDVMQSYLPQIISKLAPRGVAFLHHSNLGMLGGRAAETAERGRTVSAESVRACINGIGHVLRQEIINWGGVGYLDCLTLLARSGAYVSETSVHINNRFAEEAEIIRSCIAPWQFAPTKGESDS